MKITNRQARFNYHILETFEAGVVLSGAEVKSVREGRVDLSNSFARIAQEEAYLINAHIYPYHGEGGKDYNPSRSRKLLLHKSEISKLVGRVSKGGITLVPLSLYSTRNLIKVELALASPKQKFDKRKAIKEKDEQRKLEQELRGIKE